MMNYDTRETETPDRLGELQGCSRLANVLHQVRLAQTGVKGGMGQRGQGGPALRVLRVAARALCLHTFYLSPSRLREAKEVPHLHLSIFIYKIGAPPVAGVRWQ